MAEPHAHVRAGGLASSLRIGMVSEGVHLEPLNPKAILTVRRKVVTHEVVFEGEVPVGADGYVELNDYIPLNEVGEYGVIVDLSFDCARSTSLSGSVAVE